MLNNLGKAHAPAESHDCLAIGQTDVMHRLGSVVSMYPAHHELHSVTLITIILIVIIDKCSQLG